MSDRVVMFPIVLQSPKARAGFSSRGRPRHGAVEAYGAACAYTLEEALGVWVWEDWVVEVLPVEFAPPDSRP